MAALPELRPAAERYWQEDGPPGKDAGPLHLFENMFACYVTLLLQSPAAESGDQRRVLQVCLPKAILAGETLIDRERASVVVFTDVIRSW